MAQLTIINNREPGAEILDALHAAADVLAVDICWYCRGSFHFRLLDDWTVALTPETAGRLRIETCEKLRPRDRKWAMTDDCNRIAYLVRDALDSTFQTA